MDTVYDKFNGVNAILGQTVGGMVSSTVNLGVRRQFGFNDKADWGAMAADAFGNAVGNAIVSGFDSGSGSRSTNGTGSDWRRDAEMRLRQVAAEEEIQRLGYAETIYLDGNSTSVDRNNQSSDISLSIAIASLPASERRRLAEVAEYKNVHLNPVTQKEEIYRSWVMSFRILDDSKLQPIPMASSLPVSLPFVSGYAARNASIESNRQSAVSQWNQSKIPGVRVTGRVFANAGYNIISGANSLGSILTDPAHAENVVNSISFAVRNPSKVYDGVVNKIQDMSNRSWQENLETAAVFGSEALATAGTGFMIRRTDGALGLVDEVVTESAERVSSRPEWLQRLDAGNTFNKERAGAYDFNEVYINKPDGSGYYRLDSYNPNSGEIVSRKFTQLSDVQENTALKYINEIPAKYPAGGTIANVPSSGDLGGQLLRGQYYLEVPVQVRPIPQSIFNAADKAGVLIRDINGKVY